MTAQAVSNPKTAKSAGKTRAYIGPDGDLSASGAGTGPGRLTSSQKTLSEHVLGFTGLHKLGLFPGLDSGIPLII